MNESIKKQSSDVKKSLFFLCYFLSFFSQSETMNKASNKVGPRSQPKCMLRSSRVLDPKGRWWWWNLRRWWRPNPPSRMWIRGFPILWTISMSWIINPARRWTMSARWMVSPAAAQHDHGTDPWNANERGAKDVGDGCMQAGWRKCPKTEC